MSQITVQIRFPTCRRGLLVSEDGNASVLVLERRVDPLELLGLPLQRVDDDAPTGRAHDGHGVVDVGAVAPLAEVDVHDGVRRARVPELERLVPGAGHEGGVVRRLHPPHRLDGGAVLGHLHRLVRRQVPALDLLVAGGHEHLGAVVVPAAVQNGTLQDVRTFTNHQIHHS